MRKCDVGGQAIIEGVMMRGSKGIATAVRTPNGEIEVKVQKTKPITKKYKFLNIPIIRGAVSLIDSLILGIKTLNYSASFFEDDEEESKFDIWLKEKFGDKIIQVKSKEDIQKLMPEKYGMMLTIENGSAIQGNLKNIDYLYQKGVKMMSIVWNERNDLASGATEKIDTGLTELGKEYIKVLNEKRILVDVSHASEKTFWDTAQISNAPIVASHSCVYNLCEHPRNLKDNQIKQIAKMNGIIGVVYSSGFLNKTEKADIQDIINHIRYIKKLVGIDYVGLGSDFDGLEENHILKRLGGLNDINNLIYELKKEFNNNEIEKIMGENWLRVIGENI